MSGLLFSIIAVGLLAGVEPTTPVAAVYVLSTTRARANAFAFLVGWILSLVVVFFGAWLLAGRRQPAPESDPYLVLSVIEVALGVALIFIGLRAWRRRNLPKHSTGIPPGLEKRIENLNPTMAFGLGVYEEPWTFTIAAAVIVAREQTGILAFSIAFAVFGLLATAVVIVIFTYWLRKPGDAQAILDMLRQKIETFGPTVIVTICALGSVFLIVDGIIGIRAR